MQAAIEHVRAHQAYYLSQLFALLRLPSVSAKAEHRTDMMDTASWLAADMAWAGFEHVQVMPTAGHPVVYADWLHASADAPTVLVYGHYDVQPAEPLDLWESAPFEPVVREGRIYARGATDDKGQAFIHIKAVESMLAASGSLPVNVKVLFEGEEEIGSPHLEPFVEEHSGMLAADIVLVSDTSFLTPEQPLILYGLRGIVGAEVTITGPKRDLHSGGYGGTVHNPAQALVGILSKLHDEHHRVAIPGFYDTVRVPGEDERSALRRVPYTLAQWQQETGLQIPWNEPGCSLVEQTGARPTCEINGIYGGWQGEGIKTIIPASAGAKITMRLVPDQNPDEIGRLFAEYIRSLAPDDLTLNVELKEGGWPLLTPVDSPAVQAAAQAYETIWGAAPITMPGGGSIPILAVLQQRLRAQVVLFGFGVPDSNGHAPNEFFPVDQFYRGMEAVVRYYHNLVEDNG